MTKSPEFASEIELGPQLPNKDSIVEIYLREGKRTEEFESALSFYFNRLERLADEHEDRADRVIARLEIQMFRAEIELKIGDIDSAVKTIESIGMMIDDDPNLQIDETPEKQDLYDDLDYLAEKVHEAWSAKQGQDSQIE